MKRISYFFIITFFLLGGLAAAKEVFFKDKVAEQPLETALYTPTVVATDAPIGRQGIKEDEAHVVKSEPAPSLEFVVLCTEEEKIQGLSGMPSLPASRGYLFVSSKPEQIYIWMKDMNFPIDIYWLDENEIVVHKSANVSPSTYPESFTSPGLAQYVVETTVGAVDISLGERFELGETSNSCR